MLAALALEVEEVPVEEELEGVDCDLHVVEDRDCRQGACDDLADAHLDSGGFERGRWERHELGDVVGEAEDDDALGAEERDGDERVEGYPREHLVHLRGERREVGRCDAALEGARLVVRVQEQGDVREEEGKCVPGEWRSSVRTLRLMSNVQRMAVPRTRWLMLHCSTKSSESANESPATWKSGQVLRRK